VHFVVHQADKIVKSGRTQYLSQLFTSKLYLLKVFGKGVGRHVSTEVLDRIWTTHNIPALTPMETIMKYYLIPLQISTSVTLLKELESHKRDYNWLNTYKISAKRDCKFMAKVKIVSIPQVVIRKSRPNLCTENHQICKG